LPAENIFKGMKYEHLFFDLDHTLWDFERNSAECLEEIYHQSELIKLGLDTSEPFITSFLRINTALWDSFDRGLIHHTYIRENRFRMVFEDLGMPPPANYAGIGEVYLGLLPTKKHLLNGALDALEYLTSKGYHLHIITNGFNDIQAKKLSSSGISHLFKNVVTFETVSAKKPDKRIFEHAIKLAGDNLKGSIMIGDNWFADILGARQIGMDTIYYNPAGLEFEESPTYDIRHLNELKAIF
jgi:YjjG family noncanonical pyrimidine nucleotidase